MQEPQVTDINDKFLYSLSQLSNAFGPARETIGKRLRAAGIRPHGKRSNHDVYHIGMAAPAILAPEGQGVDEVIDPEKLPPKEYKDYWQGRKAMNDALRDEGDLIERTEHIKVVADVVKLVVMTLETMGDDLERNGVTDTDILQRIERTSDEARERLAEKLEALNDVR